VTLLIINKFMAIPRNQLISKVFYARGYIETWGTGTNKMVELCRESNLPEPIFEEYSGGFSVCFRFRSIPTIFVEGEAEEKMILDFLKQFNRLERIYAVMDSENAQSAAEIRELLFKEFNESIAERTLRKDLALLKKKGLINSSGQARARRWYKVKGIDIKRLKT